MKIRNGFVSNSSSSSFICDTEISLEKVKEKLVLMVDFYNDLNDEDNDFEDIFNEPFISDDSYCKSDWADYYEAMRNSKGKIIIESAQDNSIPYGLQNLIEDTFDAYRCHLG